MTTPTGKPYVAIGGGKLFSCYPGDRRVFVHSESGEFLGVYIDVNWNPVISREASDEMLANVLARGKK